MQPALAIALLLAAIAGCDATTVRPVSPQPLVAASRAKSFIWPRLGNARAVDGDTMAADVYLGLKTPGDQVFWGVDARERPVHIVLYNQRIRLLGVDAHEMSDGDKGKQAKAALQGLIDGADRIEILPAGDGERDSFGRLLAFVFVYSRGGEKVEASSWLIKNGHGAAYRKGK